MNALRLQVEGYVQRQPLGVEVPDETLAHWLGYYKGLMFYDVISDMKTGLGAFSNERFNMGVCHGILIALGMVDKVGIVNAWRQEAIVLADVVEYDD
jgi:hypothetical protein